jgi:superfamily I DNA/RNA helicase
MDAVELARRAAAALHAEAVATGHNPKDPLKFVTAVAGIRGYFVEDATPGAASLKGGLATINAADRLIVHQRAGSKFDQAFLVGHEIGHLELGDLDEDTTVVEVDHARPSEASPMGFDRVVDYGRRQRREIQMDLFARELILPRSVASRHHLEEGLTATQVSEMYGIEFDVVAQQLLDALLIPAVPEDTKQTGTPPTLNGSQFAAKQHRGSPFLLEAGPGTGKTQTLTARIEHLLADGVDPRRILVLTFSNKAAGEMVERLARTNPDAAAAMWMGTFHAFGLDLIRIYHAELNLRGDPRMMDRVEAAELLEREFPRLGLRHYRNLYDPTQIITDMLAAISRAKDEVAGPERYAKCAHDMLKAAGGDAARIEAAERAAEVAKVYDAYECVKRNARCIDFGDLVKLPVDLLEGFPEILSTVRSRYDHVLVDEFQDVNRASVRLLECLVSGGAELWAVGDVKQSIYRFRGASSFNVARFGKADFPGGQRGRLKRNYRSTCEIVGAFSNFAKDMAVVDGDASLVADRGTGGSPVELRQFETGALQSAAIADSILTKREAGYAWRDQAVLCTGNDRLGEIAGDLERMDIPVLFLGSVFERPEIKDLLSLISILADRRGMGLVRVATMPDFTMTMPDVVAALAALVEIDGDQPEALTAITGLSTEGIEAVGRLCAALAGFDETSRPWTVLATLLLDRTRTAAGIATSPAVADRAKGIAIWQLMNFIAVQPAGHGLPIKRLLDRIRRLVRLSEDRDLRQMPAAAQGLDAVRLMTVHGAKGLEFDVVHLPGLNAGTIPRSTQTPKCPPPDGLVAGTTTDGITAFKEGHEQEQECLFYVAMSRARDRLVMYAANYRSDGARRSVSKFMPRLGAGVVSSNVTPVCVLPDDADKRPVAIEAEDGLSFAVTQMSLFESCPRRFFYTHVLRTGGRRVTTPFMRMHEAVQSVTRQLVELGVAAAGADIATLAAEACVAAGLEDDAQFSEYASIATGLLSYFVSSRVDVRPVAPPDMSLVIDGHRLTFRPDDALIDASGVHHLRRIRTGHERSTDMKDLGAMALGLAASTGPSGAVVEVIYLSDGCVKALPLARGDGGRGKVEKVLADIAAGRFEANPSPRTCPGCPAFYVCGPVPKGELRKKF